MSSRIAIKPGVKLSGIKPEMLIALIVAEKAYPSDGILTVTSALEGEHVTSSKHYTGYAIDLRTRGISKEDAIKWRNIVESDLGLDYDCILEDDHLHIEYDPKRGINK